MASWLLLVNFSKLVGVAGVITVAANTLAYLQFRKRRLAPFDNPLDESQEILASFPIHKTDEEECGFFFAVATAPAHVEDKLDDAWLEFAQETKPTDESTEVVSNVEEEIPAAESSRNTSLPETDSRSSSKYESEMSDRSNEGGERSISDSFSEWEVVASGREKSPISEHKIPITAQKDDKKELQVTEQTEQSSSSLHSAASIEDPSLQYNLPKKGKKLLKVAMEAMVRGIEKFGEDDEEDKVNVAAWHNTIRPEERVRFWSDPDVELRLAKELHVSVFRMGVDWSRIMPVEPVDGVDKAVDWNAVKRYRWILQRVHAHGMRVMLTLFHHSLPQWSAEYGGWKEEKTLKYFLDFTRLVVEEFGELVDMWVTMNEPHVFAMLTYCAGAWPGGHPDMLETATSILPRGVFNRVMHFMSDAHNKAYDVIHELSDKKSTATKVGIAHHVSFARPYGLFDVSAAIITNWKTHFPYVDDVCKKLDFLGINYYGQEFISAPGLKLVENEEYSESGRGIYPDGLYRILLAFHQRYKMLGIPFIITENGVSDATDYIRRPYIVEHLLAIRAAMDKGVDVRGYCFWTTSDNWEWADGYGPKFGLAAVDRKNDLTRTPRPSYYLYAEIARSGKVMRKQRVKTWRELQQCCKKGAKHPFYRAVDASGRMYAGGLDVPVEREFVRRDWRFGHYEVEGLQDPLNKTMRAILNVFKINKKKKIGDGDDGDDGDMDDDVDDDVDVKEPPLRSSSSNVALIS